MYLKVTGQKRAKHGDHRKADEKMELIADAGQDAIAAIPYPTPSLVGLDRQFRWLCLVGHGGLRPLFRGESLAQSKIVF
jgi:hypothetical protein